MIEPSTRKEDLKLKNEITSKRLRQALSEANMKPQELADRSGVSKASISQYVNGSHAPSNISSAKMGKVLNVDAMWLMGFDVKKRKELNSLEANKDLDIMEKFFLLNERDQKIVLGIIDMMISTEKEK